ncbi:MAG: PrgI family protein [Minisyncoccia bacterium]
MQFKVPQFLDIEDKIFGPFTFREFAYLAGGAGLCYVFYKLLGLLLAVIPILIIAGFSGALIFYRPNNKPFINMLESGFKYLMQNKLYIWKKQAKKFQKINAAASINKNEMIAGMKLDGNRLRDLAWSLDVLDINKRNADERSGLKIIDYK